MGRLAPWEGQVESPVLIASRLLLFFTKGALKTYFKELEPLYSCPLSWLRLSSPSYTRVYTVPEAAVTLDSTFLKAPWLVQAAWIRSNRQNSQQKSYWSISQTLESSK